MIYPGQVMVDLDTIPGTLDMRKRIHLLVCFCEMEVNLRTQKKPTLAPGDHVQKLHTESNTSS